jgi:hypothetical protein
MLMVKLVKKASQIYSDTFSSTDNDLVHAFQSLINLNSGFTV